MTENASESVVRRTYQDFESGDLDLLRVVMAQDVVWHEPGRSACAGDYKGPEAVLGFPGAAEGTQRRHVQDRGPGRAQ